MNTCVRPHKGAWEKTNMFCWIKCRNMKKCRCDKMTSSWVFDLGEMQNPCLSYFLCVCVCMCPDYISQLELMAMSASAYHQQAAAAVCLSAWGMDRVSMLLFFFHRVPVFVWAERRLLLKGRIAVCEHWTLFSWVKSFVWKMASVILWLRLPWKHVQVVLNNPLFSLWISQ